MTKTCQRALALAVAAALSTFVAPGAWAHQGNPNYRSELRGVAPPVAGLHVDVLNFDDRLELVNRTGKDVTVYGYNGDVYARMLADGTVEVNHNSPAYYLNSDRTGEETVPDSASPDAPPDWEVVDKSGRFDWHDHRIHYMGKGLPDQVKDKDKRTKVFDYAVPLRVGATRAKIRGTLFWQPENSSAPAGLFASLAAFVLLSAVLVVVVRRRRRAAVAGDGTADESAGKTPTREAW